MALSERQFEILRALLNRERPEEIARRLGIGLPAVNWYRRGIFIHLGIHSKLELLPLMIAAGTFQMPLSAQAARVRRNLRCNNVLRSTPFAYERAEP